MRPRIWNAAALLLAGALSGCGGGGGGSTATPSTPGAGLTRFDVDVATGKVRVTPSGGGRAVFQGGAVSFTSSDLLTVGGDSGQRLVRVHAVNNSGQAWGASPVRLVVSNVSNGGTPDVRGQVQVSTFAGQAAIGSADGFRRDASFSAPLGICAVPGTSSPICVTDLNSSTLRRISADGMVSTLAGMPGSSGVADGTGSAARFWSPYAAAADAAGNIYVAQWSGPSVRRITPLGEVTTIAGTGAYGGLDGPAATATFQSMFGIAVSPDGNRIYLGTTGVIRLVRYNGAGSRSLPSSYTVSTVAGSNGTMGFADGVGAAARLSSIIYGVALLTDLSGVETLFIGDSMNYRIRRIDLPASGAAVVSTIAGGVSAGSIDGPGGAARLEFVNGLCAQWIDSQRFVLFASTMHSVRAATYVGGEPAQSGSYVVSTLAGSSVPGFADGDGYAARFNYLGHITVRSGTGPSATLFAADVSNNRIREIDVPSSALHSAGTGIAALEPVRLLNWDADVPVQTAWSRTMTAASGGYDADLQFYVPEGVSGFTFYAKVETNTDLVNLPGAGAATLSTVAGSGLPDVVDGTGKQAGFYHPGAVAAVPPALRSVFRTRSGQPIRAFIADTGNDRIRLLDVAGNVETFAGTTTGYADGIGLAARFAQPAGVALCPDGALCVADTGNHRIRLLWPSGQVTTVAGSGTSGSADGAGDAAQFLFPEGVAVTSGGTIYVADTANHTIRRILRTGNDPRSPASYTVATMAGLAGSWGTADGSGLSARFNSPSQIAVDSDSSLYVADTGSWRVRMLQRTSASTMTASTPVGVAGITGLALDAAHNVYASSSASHSVVRISPLGSVVGIVGGPSIGMADGPSGLFNVPRHLAVEADGTILVADPFNNAIRAVARLITSAP